MVHLYLPDFLWENNNRYSLASLFLITNQMVIHDQADYFNEFFSSSSSMNAFLHLWSLSLEMQFYLLVPFIFLGLQFLKNDYLKLLTVVLITVMGFIGFAMILDKFAFNFLFLRLWQFSAGFIALFSMKINSSELPNKSPAEKIEAVEEKKFKCPFNKEDLVIIALSILALCLMPNKIPLLILRPLVTLSTALIIGCQTEKLQPGKGNVSIMMIGNSYILNFVDQIEESFNMNYSEFRYISIIASYGTFSSSWKISEQALEISKKQVELYKPDVLFIVPRYMQNIKDPIQKNDGLLEEMNKNIEFYEKFVKRIYILDALPEYSENFFTMFLHYLITRPEDMELLHLNKKKADLDMKNVRKRLRNIKCTKCELFDLSHLFVENDKYLTFDREKMLAYVDNSVHLTTAGVAPCDPIFKNITKGILNKF
ncbi:hypothetical protein B9Z55_020063 [Caenorhabditis nigoni]|nr:hypothetical protein B9Z55_020063 [Caenorhabditis nigoni]